MAKRRKSFPQPPTNIDRQLRLYLAAIQEMIETGEGARGDPLDTKLTFRDLISSGVAKLKGSIGAGGVTGSDLEPTGVPDMSVPPVPTEFGVVPVFGAVSIFWSNPFAQYSTHSFAEVWRAEGRNAAFSNAVMIGTSRASMYSDYMIEEGAWYTYWVRFVSQTGVNGPWHDPYGTSVQTTVSVEVMLEELSDSIDESLLSRELSQKIERIDALEQAIYKEEIVRRSEDEDLARSISQFTAKLNDNAALIREEREARIKEDEALSRRITTAQVQVGEQFASVEQDLSSGWNTLNGLSAQYTLKLDVNGYVSGIGAYNDGQTSDFAILADRFWIAAPNNRGKIKPFIIQNNRTYIDTALIREASIQEGMLGPISFGKITDNYGRPITTVSGKLKAELIDVDNIQITTGNVSGDFYSTNFRSGFSGWRLERDGSVELNNATVRGTLFAQDIQGDVNVVENVLHLETNWVAPRAWKELVRFYVNLSGKDEGHYPYYMLHVRLDSHDRQDHNAGTKATGVLVQVDIFQNAVLLDTQQFGSLTNGLAGGVSAAGSHDERLKGIVMVVVRGYSHDAHTDMFRVSGMIGGLA